MAGRADVMAGRAFVSLYVDQSALVKGLRSASRQMQSFGMGIAKIGGSMMAAGGAVLGPLLTMTKQFADAGSALFDMSGRTGVSVEKLQTLGYAAQMTGVDMAGLEGAIRKMQKNGFSVDQMGAIADKLAAIEDPTKRAQAAMKIFGKTGTSMLPMLAGGAKGLAEFQATAERLGLVLSTKDAAAADTLGDAIDTLWGSFKGIRNQIGAALAPTLTKLATTLSENLVWAIEWVKANRETIVTIAKVAAIVVGVGGAITGLGMAFMAAGMALGGFASVIGLIGSALAFILSPLGLIITGLAVGTAAFITFTETGQWLAETIMGNFATAFGTVKQTISGVADALKAGEFKLAGEIAMTGLKLAFFEATKGIRTKWIEFSKSLVSVLIAAGQKMIEVISNVRKNIVYLSTGFDTWEAGETARALEADLEANKGSMSKRDYLIKRRNIRDDAAGAMLESTNRGDKKLGQIDSDKARWSASMDEFGNVVDENLNASLADGEARIAALREELAKLTGVAAERVVNLDNKPPPGPHKVAADGLGSAIKSGGVAATFSASALSALGQGGGPMANLVKINEEQKRIQAKQLKEQEKATIAWTKLEALLLIS
jgi:hypothetical protein